MQAAILTGRRSKAATSNKEIDDSVDRIVAGMEGTPMVDGKSKSLVAYHEVGHAVCGTLTPGHDAVQKVSYPCILFLFWTKVPNTSSQKQGDQQYLNRVGCRG